MLYNFVKFREISTTKLVEEFALLTTGVFALPEILAFRFYRERTWKVIKLINEKNLEISQKTRERSNQMYLIILAIWITSESSAILVVLTFLYEFQQSGKVHFTNYFYDFEAFSFGSYLSHFSHMICMFWFASYMASYTVMVVELILRLTLFYRHCGEEVRKLRQIEYFDEEEELRKLKSIIKDYNLFHWCIQEINETMRIYMVFYITLLFVTLGVYFAVILSTDSFREILLSLFVPIYLFLFLGVFCFLGQFFSDTVRH